MVTAPTTPWRLALAEEGFFLRPAVLSGPQIDAILGSLESVFAADSSGSTLRGEDGSVYGARNLLQLWPGVVEAWQIPPLPDIVADVLGRHFGLVRVLYFDKPPTQSWALPWHQDLTIAVKNNRLPSQQFGKPTCKIGVPHVEAPRWLLEQMVTVRLHLDDMTDENGPLKLLPGSHRGTGVDQPVTILGRRGDGLLMRPLVSHCSNKSFPGTTRRRRILHYEFAGVAELPDGYEWHDFVRAASG